ncbi:MAG: lysophospholipase L1-like esterase [Myxococcota bacterium]|jgi:lysophospholipase L1-like esterase
MGRGRMSARFLALGLGLLLLVGMELLTRLILGPPSEQLFAEVPAASGELTRLEGDTLELLYHGASEGLIPVRSSTRRPRVVWLGGSSVHGGNPGMPVRREAAHIAGRMLRAETINLAGPGLDSGHHLSLLPDILALSPAAVVIYAGHNDLGNEVLMARFSGSRFLRTARIRWVFLHSRMFTAMEAMIRQRSALRLPDPSMHPEFEIDDAIRAQIHGSFRQRIGLLVDALQEAGVVVVLATPTSNPIAPSLVWRCPEQLAKLGLQGRPAEAFPVSDIPREDVAALLAQQDCRDLRWILARLDQDFETLEQLRDTDPLPLRADRALTQIVRTVAAEHGALLADSSAYFHQLGGGIEPPTLFDDTMHLSEAGHQALANSVAEALSEALQRRSAPLSPIRLPPLDLAACGDKPCR